MASLPSSSSRLGSCLRPVPVLVMPKTLATFSFDSFLKRYSVGTRSTFSRRMARAKRSRGFSSLIYLLPRRLDGRLESKELPPAPRGRCDVRRDGAAAETDEMRARTDEPVESRRRELRVLVRHRGHHLGVRLRRHEDFPLEIVRAEVARELLGYPDRILNTDRAVRANNVHAEGDRAVERALRQQVLVALHNVAHAIAEERPELGTALGGAVHEGEGRVDRHAHALIREDLTRGLHRHLPFERLQYGLDAEHVDPGANERADLRQHGIHDFVIGGRLADDLPGGPYVSGDE